MWKFKKQPKKEEPAPKPQQKKEEPNVINKRDKSVLSRIKRVDLHKYFYENKSILTALFLSTGLLFSSNEIYLDQIGSAGVFNISQIGSANKLGEGTNRSRIEGEEVVFNVATIGNENLIDIDSIGNEEEVNLQLKEMLMNLF